MTHFDNGQVWVRDEQGTVAYEHKGSAILGRLCDVSAGPVRIDPSVHHAVMPWQGDRIVRVAYMPAFADRLSIADRSSLSELGFVFRNINADASAALRDIR